MQGTRGTRGTRGTGVHPKIETRKLGTLFIEWKGVEIGKEPCLHPGVQRERGAADAEGRKRVCVTRGTKHQTQCVVPLARCVPQGGDGRLRAAGWPASRPGSKAWSNDRSASGRHATDRGIGTQDRPANPGPGFFAKSLQGYKGVSPEQCRTWRDSIYAEIGDMMQFEGFQASHACQILQVSRAGFYRHFEEHQPRQADVWLRDLIQQI